MTQGRLAPVLMLILLASCGADNGSADQSNGGEVVDKPTLAKISLTSAAFRDGQPMPKKYSCDGANQSPPLHWGEPPPGTRSFALVIDDPDAPGGTFRHWGIYNIPASARGIEEGQSAGSEAINDKGSAGYTGPCPPKGDGAHHYHLRLFALGIDKLDLGTDAKVINVEMEASKNAIGAGELIGTYERH
jgi:Raf kinase inhibitor-like YbhB/YbcL family protein